MAKASFQVKHFWGTVEVPAQCYENKAGEHCQLAPDRALNTSGWTANALKVMSKLAASLSYAKAYEVIGDFEVLPGISRAGLERLSQPYAAACQAEIRERLETAQGAELATGESRKMFVKLRHKLSRNTPRDVARDKAVLVA